MLIKLGDGMEIFIEWSPAAKNFFVGLWEDSDACGIWAHRELTALRDNLTEILNEHNDSGGK